MSTRLPAFYLNHGAGPWPYMNGEFRRHHALLEASLKDLPRQIGVKPRAILVVSAHWEEKDFAVMAGLFPPMVYDFSGFPPETYAVRYLAPGAPALAKTAAALIKARGLAAHLDEKRGFDHGAYALLAVAFPDADVPVIQVSLRADYDPAAHLELGRALAPLRDEGVLIIGSGSSYHNLDALRGRTGGDPSQQSRAFDDWLTQTLVDSPPEERAKRLVQWQSAPDARAVHPHEEHLLPLHVAAGAGEADAGQIMFHDQTFFDGLTLSSYRFG